MDVPDETTPLHQQSNLHRNLHASDSLSPSDDRAPESSPIRLKVASAAFSFIVLGLFTSSIGALLPSFEQYYSLSDRQASYIFLFVVGGYVLGAQLNDFIHSKFGQRGVAIIGPAAHLISVSGASLHPPYSILLILIAIGAFGTGTLDGSWSSWAGALEKASTISGLLHGAFSTGAAAGPALVGALLSMEQGKWYQWYSVLAVASLTELLCLSYAFWVERAEAYRQSLAHNAGSATVLGALKYRVVWGCAIYLLAYVGFESAISGWVVVFMGRQRHASRFLASLSSSGFWGVALCSPIRGFGVIPRRYDMLPISRCYHVRVKHNGDQVQLWQITGYSLSASMFVGSGAAQPRVLANDIGWKAGADGSRDFLRHKMFTVWQT
ncbi:Bypass of stop codon protein [Paramyrothecium foliicola]|nr:Bypass of stop codon protein [Paramyrothecium foliicola]